MRIATHEVLDVLISRFRRNARSCVSSATAKAERHASLETLGVQGLFIHHDIIPNEN